MSLQGLLDEETLAKVDAKAVRDAVIETELDRHQFPNPCPWTLAQILDEDWLPEDAG